MNHHFEEKIIRNGYHDTKTYHYAARETARGYRIERMAWDNPGVWETVKFINLRGK